MVPGLGIHKARERPDAKVSRRICAHGFQVGPCLDANELIVTQVSL